MNIQNQIRSLFKNRDKAVLNNDRKLFLSTQIKEIDGSSSKGYLDTGKIQSTVLHIHKDEFEENVWIAFVKEEYFKADKLTHNGYLIYTIVERKGELIISNIRW